MGSPSQIFRAQPHNISWNLPSGCICGGKTPPTVYQKDPIGCLRNWQVVKQKKGRKDRKERGGRIREEGPAKWLSWRKALPAKSDNLASII